MGHGCSTEVRQEYVLSRAVHAQVVTAPTPWQGGIVAISSFGFGGSNVHAIIAGCVRPKGPPPRALPAPEPAQVSEDIENGGTVIEEVQEGEPEPEPLLFPPEASRSSLLGVYQAIQLW